MVSTFPDALDSLATTKADSTAAVSDHPAHHNNLAAAVNAIQSVIRGGSGVYNVNHYDNIDTAIDTAEAAGGGIVYLPPGTFSGSARLTLPENVLLMGAGPGITILRQQIWSGALITATGSIASSATATLDADAEPPDGSGTTDSQTLTLVSTSGLTAGDVCRLSSGAAFDSGEATKYKGELVRIKSVDSATAVTLYGMVRDTYLTSDTAILKKVTLLEGVGVMNLTIENTAQGSHDFSGQFINFTYCKDPVVANVHLKYCDGPGILVDTCLGGRITESTFEDFSNSPNDNQYGYGVGLYHATEQVTVANCHFRRVRTAVTTSGFDDSTGVPRDCLIVGCTASEMIQNGFSTHPTSQGITFSSCTVSNSATAAFQLRDRDSRIVGCSISWCREGIWVTGVTGHGGQIIGNTIRHMVVADAANGDGVGGGNGIHILASSGTPEGVVISHNNIDACQGVGILINEDCQDLTLAHNAITNTGRSGTAAPAVLVSTGVTVDSLRMVGNHVGNIASTAETGAAGNQNYGLVNNGTVTNSFLANNTAVDLGVQFSTGITHGSDGNVLTNNREIDKVTEASGTATIANGATSATVTHGLSATPTLVLITLKEDPTNDPPVVWVSDAGATTFKVNCADPGASGLDVYWLAKV